MFDSYYFSDEHLSDLADLHRDRFRTAEPFPHIVLDDFLPEWVLDTVLSEFPKPGEVPWKTFERATSKKLASEGDAFFGELPDTCSLSSTRPPSLAFSSG
ncbi:hypothetical protein [Streptomyces plumbiresistens]|uniref:Uncharacterized protein n=1 Tax=Streptomyces plumbiresistens TaxID=511811 RepID=A0ABP7T3A4_9ACTN